MADFDGEDLMRAHGLLHKTDRGLVHLNLLDANAVENAVQEIAAEASEELEGFLIQPHLKRLLIFPNGENREYFLLL